MPKICGKQRCVLRRLARRCCDWNRRGLTETHQGLDAVFQGLRTGLPTECVENSWRGQAAARDEQRQEDGRTGNCSLTRMMGCWTDFRTALRGGGGRTRTAAATHSLTLLPLPAILPSLPRPRRPNTAPAYCAS